MNLSDLQGEVAVVIGATGALGGAIAEGFATAGAIVAVLGRNEARGAACVRKIIQGGGQAKFFQIDAMHPETLSHAHQEIRRVFGPPTILLNGAGGTDPDATVTAERPFEKVSVTAWQNNFDLNLVGGVLLPCQEFGPAMTASRKGTIINIASVSAHIPLSRVVAYSAAKAAVISLTQFLAREWAPNGVRVNSVTPGFFPAEQNRHLLFEKDGTPTARARMILGHTPMGRFGQAAELVGAAIFLASSRASGFVTGTDIRVDGGFLSQTI